PNAVLLEFTNYCKGILLIQNVEKNFIT
ncbi:MAG: hypothetical protein PWQ43_434, partial [Rikenellaceae bacterium]|nr:hypothetical protein [Rikenellaceae bacterium]MDI3546255.1 hypothetical protein [Rikenellaceae bacterium]MDN5355492.1 hypothetical protein [Rikenellaceae bacterium]